MTQKIAYTYEQAAEQVGYSERTIRQAVKDGNLRASFANTKGVIQHEELVEWVKSLPAEYSKAS